MNKSESSNTNQSQIQATPISLFKSLDLRDRKDAEDLAILTENRIDQKANYVLEDSSEIQYKIESAHKITCETKIHSFSLNSEVSPPLVIEPKIKNLVDSLFPIFSPIVPDFDFKDVSTQDKGKGRQNINEKFVSKESWRLPPPIPSVSRQTTLSTCPYPLVNIPKSNLIFASPDICSEVDCPDQWCHICAKEQFTFKEIPSQHHILSVTHSNPKLQTDSDTSFSDQTLIPHANGKRKITTTSMVEIPFDTEIEKGKEQSPNDDADSLDSKRSRRRYKYFTDTHSTCGINGDDSCLAMNSTTNNTEEPKTKQGEIFRCSNCGTRNTPAWRRDMQGIALLCNACGIYLKLNGRHRPVNIGPDGEIHLCKDQRKYKPSRTCANCKVAGSIFLSDSNGQEKCNRCGVVENLSNTTADGSAQTSTALKKNNIPLTTRCSPY
ncbi:hypothetical protein G9A89_002512 [Geosiphon pyriformis]|nr:hypothetical protein G9A89_002512 [Geosiphon pyriformis]